MKMKRQKLPSGILHLSGDDTFPRTLAEGGVEYTHLIGGIYLPCPMHELTLPQLQDVNRLRDMNFQKEALEQKNDVLKTLVADVMTDCAGGRGITVVDIGCGTTTIAPYFNKLARFVGVDIDPEAVRALRDKGVESCTVAEMPALELGGGMNAFVALYMLQFKIDDHFFGDVAKLMKNDDLMFANLYRIPDERKQGLKTQAEKAGLCIEEVPDTLLSPGRQVFWAVSKKPNAAAQLARRVEKGLGGFKRS